MDNEYRIDIKLGNEIYKEVGTFQVDKVYQRCELNDIMIINNTGYLFDVPIEVRITRIH